VRTLGKQENSNCTARPIGPDFVRRAADGAEFLLALARARITSSGADIDTMSSTQVCGLL
jgi:hypothetical protein